MTMASPMKKESDDKEGTPRWQKLRGFLFPVLILLSYLAWTQLGHRQKEQSEVRYSTFVFWVEQGIVESVQLSGASLSGKLKKETEVDGQKRTEFTASIPAIGDDQLMPALRQKGVKIEVKNDDSSLAVYTLLNVLGPFVLFAVFIAWMSRRGDKMMGPLAGMMKGRVRRFQRDQAKVTFSEVAGQKAAKRDLQEIVEFLKHPEGFQRLGAKVPKGVLLVGPPGTGKTLLARAVAGEAEVPFFSINGSEFIEMFVGVGASRVRELFEEAHRAGPSIVFIDEIDAVGRARGAGLGGGHDEREQTLNQLLSEMDGFSKNHHTIVIAATNRPDVLDGALLRPGRFDRRVVVDRPEREAREAILMVHTRNKPLESDVRLSDWARDTPGFSGADLENLCNEAALLATRRGGNTIASVDFRAAYDKIVLGELRDAKLTTAEKERVAVHEAGHAIVAYFTSHAEPPQRVTILPRGMALGVTQQAREEERFLMTEPEIRARLAVLLGGLSAEKLVLGNQSSGAENDLKRASELAFSMVAHFGMSESIGPVYFEHRTEHPFLGQKALTEGGTSDRMIYAIEEEARQVLRRARDAAADLISARRSELDSLVSHLLEHETIEETEIKQLLGERG